MSKEPQPDQRRLHVASRAPWLPVPARRGSQACAVSGRVAHALSDASVKWASDASITALLRAKTANGQHGANSRPELHPQPNGYCDLLLALPLLPATPSVVPTTQQLETRGANKRQWVLGRMLHVLYLISTSQHR